MQTSVAEVLCGIREQHACRRKGEGPVYKAVLLEGNADLKEQSDKRQNW